MIFRILDCPFYYGEFEYPKGSGEWYTGTHKPLITKEFYEQVRERLKVPPKGIWGRKHFYFSKIFKCGCCGSGITGEEKFSRQGKRYVYYRCNRHGGKGTCHEKHIREEALIEGLVKLCESMTSYKPLLDKKLTKEIDKINAMQQMIHGENAKITTKMEYLHFIFTGGSDADKGEILRQFGERMVLKEGVPEIVS